MRVGCDRLSLLVAVGLTLFYNVPFWAEMFRLRGDLTPRNVLFNASLAVLLVAAFYLLLSLSAFRFVQKPFLIVLLPLAAVLSYYIDSYGVLIDSTMIRNIIGTDTREVADLLTLRLFVWVLLLGVLPALFVYRTRVSYGSWTTLLKRRVLGTLASVAAIALAVAPFYRDYSSIFPQERHLRHMITPTNFVYGAAKVIYGSLGERRVALWTLGADARLFPTGSRQEKKTVVILVVGETARARQFSLNGYQRETNPVLRAERVLNFENAWACGTSTVIALPCMFSNLSRAGFDGRKARGSEGLLDVLAHAGVSVAWRENNSGGCKGACDRVVTQAPEQLWDPAFCESGECFDEVLLHGLAEQLESAGNNALVVLHQQGSHGPAYYRRYPEAFRRFTPTCESTQLQDCSEQEIVNTYDNTILYTDYFLGRVIEFLETRSDRYNAAMLYVSDHGESLGEQGVYLHGLPYFMAPEAQKRIPWIVWISTGFESAFDVDPACLAKRHAEMLSHDNLFHSVLGLLNVRSQVYDAGLDLFSECRLPGLTAVGVAPPAVRRTPPNANG